jgi:hypothetical protein
MIAAAEYQTVMFASGGTGASARVFSFDGTTVSNVTATIGAVTSDTIGTVVDVRPFNGFAYFLLQTAGITQVVNIVKYNGSTYSLVATIGGDGPVHPGCLEPAGDKLFFTYRDEENTLAPLLDALDTGDNVLALGVGPADTGEKVMSDMVAF